ncbi:capsular exopolysaccharide synthesis family protein [Catalinimonas alkaloidigena]|uniref:tyrosine-protein kinase family protein n=1 Tax=Catalinimonas alkaloidigena TaxID=1075417 RepID=UPI0024051D2B|nr:tyrosine-protein kinase family protein [Catalinimonas alkaloidigena]MDF9798367.1 capsular exopolysaccharide synthesis family protein [Catalinimonas alkaloidigena]
MQQEDNKLIQQKLLRLVKNRWYLILGSVILTLLTAYAINRYSTPTYRVKASLMVKDPQKSMTYADLIFENSSNNNINLTNETVLLKSYQYVAATIADLDFEVAYFREGVVKTTELYGNSPIQLTVDQLKSENIPYGKRIRVNVIDQKNYELYFGQENVSQGVFGQQQNINGFVFTITAKQSLSTQDILAFEVATADALTRQYMAKLQVHPLVSNSSILEISLLGSNPEKEIAFLNAYMKNVSDINLHEKNLNHQKAINFIDQQLNFNKDTLQEIESRLVNFKDENNSIDLDAETAQIYSKVQTLEERKAEVLMVNQYYDYLIKTLKNEQAIDQVVIPATMGIDDPILNEFVSELVSTQIEVNTIASEKRYKNPILIEKEQSIEELKVNIMANVENLRGANDVTIQNIDQRLSKLYASLQKVPEAQRELISIQRNYGLSENLYMLLMEKKMEESIKLAGNASDYRMVNGATVAGPQVSPNSRKNYLLALLLGAIAPLGLMYLFIVLNTKVTSKEDILLNSSFPIVSSIPNYKEKYRRLSDIKPDTATAEAFRTLRSNLNYLIGSNKGKVITISSCVSGEGKTYCSQHLAYILALANHKVMLINADLRKPDAHQEYYQNPKGLSEYLAGFATYKEVVNTSDLANLKVINSGALPPNPSELLINYRMESLLLDLKNEDFDYIILDTAPMGIFSDALEISRQADLTLFVVKHGYTPRSSMQLFNELMGEKNLSNAVILYNGVPAKESRYGYDQYYYSYGNKKKKFLGINI